MEQGQRTPCRGKRSGPDCEFQPGFSHPNRVTMFGYSRKKPEPDRANRRQRHGDAERQEQREGDKEPAFQRFGSEPLEHLGNHRAAQFLHVLRGNRQVSEDRRCEEEPERNDQPERDRNTDQHIQASRGRDA